MPLLLALLAPACSGSQARGPEPGDHGAERPVRLTFVTLNDFHGALYETPVPGEPGRAAGGLPWLAGALDLVRAENPNVIVLDAGDLFQGSWPVNQSSGLAAVRVHNFLGVDAAAVGNHEFDYGSGPDAAPSALRGALLAAAREARFHWLAANIYVAARGDLRRWQPEGFAPWTMIERAGVKIGIIGVTTTDTPQTTLSRNVADLVFADPVETVRDLLPELEAGGAEVVVVLAHLTGSCEPTAGIELASDCRPDGELGRLLDELPRGSVDLIVAGHAHALLSHRIDDTFVVEARSDGQMLGRADLVVGPEGLDLEASSVGPPWFLVHDAVEPGCEGGEYPLEPRLVGGRQVTPSADALALVRQFEAESGSLCDALACSARHLTRDEEAESEIGSLIADAIRGAFPDVDVALHNSGGIRADLPSGVLRREDIHALMPFDNRLLLLELTGEQLQQVVRIGSSGAHGILQVSGARYRFDPELEGGEDLDGDGTVDDWEQNRLCWVTIDGRPLDPEARYRVVTTDFLQQGGNHLGWVLGEARILEEGPLMRDRLVDYFGALPACVGESAGDTSSGGERIERGSCR